MNVIPGKVTTVGLLIAAFLLSALVAYAGDGDRPASLLQSDKETPSNLFPTAPTTFGPYRAASGENVMPIGTEEKKHSPDSLGWRIFERILLLGATSYGMSNPDAYEQRPGELPPARFR